MTNAKANKETVDVQVHNKTEERKAVESVEGQRARSPSQKVH